MLEQLVKKVDFSMLNILGILVENQSTVIFFFFFFTILPFLPVPPRSIIMPGPHNCFGYCNFVESFEIDKCESILLVFSRNYYLGLFVFGM